MRPRTVGILGGMGPEATILLMQKVIDRVHAKDDADHVPLIVDQNTQVPSRVRYLIGGQGTNPGPVLAAMARRVVGAGAEALAMPCNTAHHFAPAIRMAVDVPFIDMVALSVARAADLAGQGGRVGILGSPALRRVGLYDAPLAAAGLIPVYPADEAALLMAIRRLKAEGRHAPVQETLRAASAELAAAGARVQMVACTEFSLIADSLTTDDPGAEVSAFDTLDLLAAAIVAFATGHEAGR